MQDCENESVSSRSELKEDKVLVLDQEDAEHVELDSRSKTDPE